MNHTKLKRGQQIKWMRSRSSSQQQHHQLIKVTDHDPHKQLYARMLQECKAVDEGKRIHDRIAANAKLGDTFLANLIVRMYGRCGSVDCAAAVFDQMHRKNVFSWTIMIAAYAQNARFQQALVIYHRMNLEGVKPDQVALSNVLGVCSSLRSLSQGVAVHDRIVELGSAHDPVLGNGLINMYSRCGGVLFVDRAWDVFSSMPTRTTSSWNSMIAAFADCGCFNEAIQLFRCMLLDQGEAQIDEVTLLELAGICATKGPPALDQGREIYELAVKRGYNDHLTLSNSLINMFARCGSLPDASRLFQNISNSDVVTWNAIINAFVGEREALQLYSQMDVEPDRITFISLLETCGKLKDLKQGLEIHAKIAAAARRFDNDTQLLNSLLLMYAQCGRISDAKSVFDGIAVWRRTVASWNSMLAAYSGKPLLKDDAFRVFWGMCLEGFKADRITLVTLIDQAERGDVWRIQEIVESLPGLKQDATVATSLVILYCRCGDLESAKAVFEGIERKDVVAWTAMISALTQLRCFQQAMRLYLLMDLEGSGCAANEVTFSIVICSCAHLGHLFLARLIHQDVAAAGFDSHQVVGTALVDLFTKCGSFGEARQAFDRIGCKSNTACWNAMMQRIDCRRFQELYRFMVLEGASPDEVTLTNLLSCCSHRGAAGGALLRDLAADHGLEWSWDHQQSVIDALGRSGRLEEAEEELIEGSWEPGIAEYTALLGACATAADVERGARVAQRILDLTPCFSAPYILLGNVYKTPGIRALTY